MKLPFTRRSLRNPDIVREHIAQDDPSAANRVIARSREAIDGLTLHPLLGRAERIADTRELVVSGTRYIVLYTGDVIVILAVLHGARSWPRSTF